MRGATSTTLATMSIALILAGVNDHNPHQYLCLAVALLLGVASTMIGRK